MVRASLIRVRRGFDIDGAGAGAAHDEFQPALGLVEAVRHGARAEQHDLCDVGLCRRVDLERRPVVEALQDAFGTIEVGGGDRTG